MRALVAASACTGAARDIDRATQRYAELSTLTSRSQRPACDNVTAVSWRELILASAPGANDMQFMEQLHASVEQAGYASGGTTERPTAFLTAPPTIHEAVRTTTLEQLRTEHGRAQRFPGSRALDLVCAPFLGPLRVVFDHQSKDCGLSGALFGEGLQARMDQRMDTLNSLMCLHCVHESKESQIGVDESRQGRAGFVILWHLCPRWTIRTPEKLSHVRTQTRLVVLSGPPTSCWRWLMNSNFRHAPSPCEVISLLGAVTRAECRVERDVVNAMFRPNTNKSTFGAWHFAWISSRNHQNTKFGRLLQICPYVLTCAHRCSSAVLQGLSFDRETRRFGGL